MSDRENEPTMSVVLVVPDTYETIRKTVHALCDQTIRKQLELVIVCPSKEGLHLREDDLQPFCRYHIIENGEFISSAQSRAEGLRAASAPLVSFPEDHTFPQSHWAQYLVEEHHGDWAGVGPEMLNANPHSMTSWANMILALGSWMEPQTHGIRKNIPPHTSVYKRNILLAYGEKIETKFAVENLMQDDLRAKGYRFSLQPEAKVKHLNISKLSSYLCEQYFCGRFFGAARCSVWSPLKRFVYSFGSPFIPIKKFPALIKVIRQARRHKQLVPRVLPSLMVGLLAHSLGEMIGYARGEGPAREKMTALEFHHDRHLCSVDRMRFARQDD